MKKAILFVALILTAWIPAIAQNVQQAQFTTVQSRIDYLLFLPKSYSEQGQSVPLIIFLHGSGERGNDLNKLKAWGPPALVEKNPDFPFMVVSPQVPENEWWNADRLKGMIDEVLAKYNVDRRRVYLTGLSMGGFGTWELASRYPDYFAAVAPICGGGIPLLVGKMKHVPTWVFHGKKDPVVPEHYSADMVEALKAAGGDVTYTVLPDGEHIDAWVYAYEKSDLFDWFLQHHR